MSSQSEQPAGLEAVIQKLEETLGHEGSREERTLMLGEGDCCSSPVPIPACIRQIITGSLAEQPSASSEEMHRVSFQDENLGPSRRSAELLKGLFSHTCMDRDQNQLPVKQSARSGRVEQLLGTQTRDVDGDATSMEHQRLIEVERNYKRMLQACQEGQQKQAQLVQRLQAMVPVLHYKKRCGELEEAVLERTSECGTLQLSLQAHLDTSAGRLHRLEQDYSMDLRRRTCQLEEEQRRCASLSQVNAMVRRQLEQASTANSSLVERLTRAQDEADQKEAKLHREQETCASRLGREQARVGDLWRQTASLRNRFTQLRAYADRSLSDMSMECITISHRLSGACKRLEGNLALQSGQEGQEVSSLEKKLKKELEEAKQLQAHWNSEKVELENRILGFSSTVTQLKAEMAEKETDLASLRSSLDKMEERKANGCSEIEVLRREIRSLQENLHSITQLVCGDNISEDGVQGLQTRHPPSRRPPQSSPSPCHPDRVLMMVQSALCRYKLQVQELRTQLENSQEQMATLHKQLQEGEVAHKGIAQLRQERQPAERALEESSRDAQQYNSSLDIKASDKGSLEKRVLSLNQQTDSQKVELEALRSTDLELRRQQDLLQQQQEELQRESERWCAKAERGNSGLEQLKEKNSCLLKEVMILNETLSKVTLQKEVLEDEKASLAQALSKVEQQRTEQEVALVKMHSREAKLQDSLAKTGALSEGLAEDKVELNRMLLQVEHEKAELAERKREMKLECRAAKEKVGQLEQELLDISTAKQILESSHRHLLDTQQTQEDELRFLKKEMAQAVEQHAQVSRQREALLEQLALSRQETELQAVALQRGVQEREALAKDKACLEVQLSVAERGALALAQDRIALRAEKEALESSVFEAQELVSALEGERGQLVAQNQSLLQNNEALRREAARLQEEVDLQAIRCECDRETLENRLAQAQKDTQLALSSSRESHQMQLDAEKEQLRAELTAQWEKVEQQLQQECEQLRIQKQEELLRLRQELEDGLQQAESHKHQALFLKDAEKIALSKKLAALQKELAAARMEIETLKNQQEQDKNTISDLSSELQEMRLHLEELQSSQAEAMQRLKLQVEEEAHGREVALQEAEVLQRELQAVEEGWKVAQQELEEARRELQQYVQGQDAHQKEVQDLRQALVHEAQDKEALLNSNQALRSSVEKAGSDCSSLRRALEEKEQRLLALEQCKASLQQEAAELRTDLQNLERSCLKARRDAQELRRQVKSLQGEAGQRAQELQDLQMRLSREELQEEANHREALGLRQRALEGEAAKDAALKEVRGLRHRIAELEVAERHCVEELQASRVKLQESERRRIEDVKRLERELRDAALQMREVNERASLAEGRVQALEKQLSQKNFAHRELENRLTCLSSLLRCTLGISCQIRSSHCRVSPVKGCESLERSSPTPGRSTSRSPVRSVPTLHADTWDAELESVQAVLHQFLHELQDTQKGRDEAQTQVHSLTSQLEELQSSRDSIHAQQQQLQKALTKIEEDKREAVDRLGEMQALLAAQEDARRQGDKEQQRLREEVATLKCSLQAAEAGARTLQCWQEKLLEAQASEGRLDAEHQKLKDALEVAKGRASQLQLHQHSLEGELQQVRTLAAEKEAEVGRLQEQMAALQRELGESKQSCGTLRVDVERLGALLARAENREAKLQEQLQSLSASLNETSTSAGALQEQVAQLQKSLVASEQEHRKVQEQLETTQELLSKCTNENYGLTVQVSNLKRSWEETDERRRELEMQTRTFQEAQRQRQYDEEERSRQLQEEKDSLHMRVASLQGSLEKLQNERSQLATDAMRLGKDKASLRKMLNNVNLERLQLEEKLALAVHEKQCLEQDLSSMQAEVQQLQVKVSELERTHPLHLLEMTERHQQELELETRRLRAAQQQAEQSLEAREKAHRQRVTCLEEQVCTLKEQLEQEVRRRQAYVSQMIQPEMWLETRAAP